MALLLAKGKIAHDRINAALAPAIDRFRELETDERDRFLDALKRFIRTYTFLSQVVAFTDVKLERNFLFCRAPTTPTPSGPGATRPALARLA